MIIKIKKLIDSIFDFILPKDIEILEIEKMSETEILSFTQQANDIKDDKCKALFQYKDKISRKAIWAIKYNKNRTILKKFSFLLYEFIMEDISEKINFYTFDNPLLVPIPMHKNNLKERGYNQSELITKEIFKIDEGKNFNISISALLKIKETPHQSLLKNKTERIKNLKDCFWADKKVVSNRNIILIDDVITTGTTMNEASRALKIAGAKKVIGFSLAH